MHVASFVRKKVEFLLSDNGGRYPSRASDHYSLVPGWILSLTHMLVEHRCRYLRNANRSSENQPSLIENVESKIHGQRSIIAWSDIRHFAAISLKREGQQAPQLVIIAKGWLSFNAIWVTVSFLSPKISNSVRIFMVSDN